MAKFDPRTVRTGNYNSRKVFRTAKAAEEFAASLRAAFPAATIEVVPHYGTRFTWAGPVTSWAISTRVGKGPVVYIRR